MSIHNFSNSLEKILFQNPWGESAITASTYGEVILQTSQPVDLISIPELPSKVLYTPAASNGLYTIDANSVITINKPGLYSISVLSTFYEANDANSVLFDGNRKHFIELTQNATSRTVGYSSIRSSVAETAINRTDSATTVYSSFVLPLTFGDQLIHFVSAYDRGALSDIALLGLNNGPNGAVNSTKTEYATKLQIAFISS